MRNTNKDAYVFKADLPGLKKEDIEITTTGNRLQISGKRESELKDGVLTLVVPKKPEIQAKKIAIGSAGPKS